MTKHAEYRLLNRIRQSDKDTALKLLNAAEGRSNAALVAKSACGAALVVIVREYRVVTLMYARQAQITLAHLRVNEIITL